MRWNNDDQVVVEDDDFYHVNDEDTNPASLSLALPILFHPPPPPPLCSVVRTLSIFWGVISDLGIYLFLRVSSFAMILNYRNIFFQRFL